MLSVILASVALVGLLFAGAALWMLFREQAKMRVEVSQSAVELAVLHEKVRHAQEQFGAQVEKVVSRQEAVSEHAAELQERFQRVEMHAGLCVPPKPAASGFNINKRVEVIRLFKDGLHEEEIAEQLAVPLGEVRLLIYLERNQNEAATTTPRRRGRQDGSFAA